MSDRRETPANDRVVAAWLAAAYPELEPVRPELRKVAVPVADLSDRPGGARARQLLYGSCFEVFEVRDGYAFGLFKAMPYVGWIAMSDLAPWEEGGADAVWVGTRQTHAYSAPDFKSWDSRIDSQTSQFFSF